MDRGLMLKGGVLGAIAFASPVAAQTARTLDVGLSGTAEYHSNVAKVGDDLAALRGVTPEDVIFTPSASIDFYAPIGRQGVFLRGYAGYSFYQENTELNRERVDLSGGLNTRLGPCAGTLSGGYARGSVYADDPLLDANIENIRQTKRVMADVNCSRQIGFGVNGSVSREWGDNDLPAYETADYERTSYSVGVSYRRPTFGALTLFASRDETEYPNRVLSPGYTMNSYGVRYERQFGARIQGTVSLSRANLDQEGILSRGEVNTTTYSAGLTYRASERLRLQGQFDHAVLPSSAIGGTYDLSTIYRVSADYSLSSRLSLNLGAGRVEREAGGTLIPSPTVRLTDTTVTSLNGGLRYKQSDRLSFLLFAGRDKRTANAPQFEYADNRVGITADVSF